MLFGYKTSIGNGEAKGKQNEVVMNRFHYRESVDENDWVQKQVNLLYGAPPDQNQSPDVAVPTRN